MTDFSSAASFNRDPKHLGFSFARYKFVSKMVYGLFDVAEIGAGDGLLSEIIQRVVGRLSLYDIKGNERVKEYDFLHNPLPHPVNALYALDVLEHIHPIDEKSFMKNIIASLMREDGTCIIGLPSLESQSYARAESKEHHVNCKTEEQLREMMKLYFRNVFLFGMNDETLHTGFGAMCHYRLAIGSVPK